MKTFDEPDDTYSGEKVYADSINAGGVTAYRAAFEPDHDAWTVGDEACVFLDFGPTLTPDAAADAMAREQPGG